IMRRGYIDHSDSLGATARFGPGDVQWLTAGKGIVHSEMFPLLDSKAPNPLELFQIWLNLPGEDKFVEPHFAMLWDKDVPRLTFKDSEGRTTEVTVVAGSLGGAKPSAPPPKSWASRADTDVAIWTIRMSSEAAWTLPPAQRGTNRMLYFFGGSSLLVGGRAIPLGSAIRLRPDAEAVLQNGKGEGELLLLQGRPIGEPVVQYGPFVMNTRAEIQQAMSDYQRTQFGGWPWPADDPVQARSAGRNAKHADGRVEQLG
ncbi:MAG TPA: pirin-like C-terminal cupin domain-containing protein, partial [Terriglobia bacterium]|nr:pirin-like C-terminal cupin domain-containing protein [Terriglobia bacterium]